jgi:hypothetical protein
MIYMKFIDIILLEVFPEESEITKYSDPHKWKKVPGVSIIRMDVFKDFRIVWDDSFAQELEYSCLMCDFSKVSSCFTSASVVIELLNSPNNASQ